MDAGKASGSAHTFAPHVALLLFLKSTEVLNSFRLRRINRHLQFVIRLPASLVPGIDQ